MSLLAAAVFTATPAHANEGTLSVEVGGQQLTVHSPIAPLSAQTEVMQLGILMLRLDTAQRFSTNINIQQQRFPTGLAGYRTLSLGQFSQLGMTVLHDSITGSGPTQRWEVEYTGTMGRPLHFLAHAYAIDDSVLLVTCTAPLSTWSVDEAICRQAMESATLTPKGG